ncbi:MAG TPA: chemotaxis protein CheX [Stenomitos sp.]
MANDTTRVARLDYVRAFIQAATSVIAQVVGEEPTVGTPVFQIGPMVNLGDVNVSLGITGDIPGQVNYGMAMQTSLNIASAMLMETVEAHDEMSISALQELGNMISGNARTYLAELQLFSDITPPKTVVGKDISANWHRTRAMSIPLTLSYGTLMLVVGIRQ